MYAGIKIGGFAMGIAACLLIALFIWDETHYDRHYPDKERIFRVIGIMNDDGKFLKTTQFPAPFYAAIKADIPEAEQTGRYLANELFGAGNKQVRRSDQRQNNYEEGVTYMDQQLLDIFQPPFVYGNPATALARPNTIVISKSKADKYFPGENPVGKTLILDNDIAHPFTVGGVIADFPVRSHFRYSFLLTMTGRDFYPGEQTNWLATNYPTYLKVRPGTDIHQLETKLVEIIKKYWFPKLKEAGNANADKMTTKVHFELQPVADIHLLTPDGIFDALPHGDIRFVWLFAAIAAFILLIAAINFINLSTARSADRAMETGLRKAMGCYRTDLIAQFLTESVLLSYLSFAVGLLIAWALLPYFNVMANKTLVMPWTAWWLLPIISLFALVIGVLAGLYPAFYLSAFKPIEVLKGKLKTTYSKTNARSVLVVFQFAASIVLIIATTIIYRQINFILERKTGFDKEQVLLLQGANTLGNKIPTFKRSLQQLAQVQSVSVSDFLPVTGTLRNGNSFWKEGRSTEDPSVGGQNWTVDHDYVRTMGIKIIKGRDFSATMPTDSQAIIINAAMAKALNLTTPIGQRITNGTTYTVIGMMEDFNFESLKENVKPLSLTLGNSPSIITVKVKTTDMTGTVSAIAGLWKQYAPDQPIRYTFLDQRYAAMYADVQRMGYIFTSFAALAIVIACLGLFGLSAFTAQQRYKEIGIRKVLGASISNLILLLSKDFIRLVFIAILLAIPFAWYAMHKWLENYAYHVNIEWWMFALAGLVAICIAVLTVSFQSAKAALMNPVRALKAE